MSEITFLTKQESAIKSESWKTKGKVDISLSFLWETKLGPTLTSFVKKKREKKPQLGFLSLNL